MVKLRGRAAIWVLPLVVMAGCGSTSSTRPTTDSGPSVEYDEVSPTAKTESFDGRFLDTSIEEGFYRASWWEFSDITELAQNSKYVFVGTLAGSTRDLRETPMSTDPDVVINTTMIWDGLVFSVTEPLIGDLSPGQEMEIAHPALLRYGDENDALVRIDVEPIELLATELGPVRTGSSFLLFVRETDDGFLTFAGPSTLVPLREDGRVAPGAGGLFSHVTSEDSFGLSVESITDLLRSGTPIPLPTGGVPTPADKGSLPTGTRYVEPGPDPVSPCEGLSGSELREAELDNRC